ncbi:pentapeptide repeat-containing protein [Streptomyces sp. SKN60]|uniref:pentapeptide repeat-containing protein n=1 Tax=Streptomyces sp. SKN60 TaxID=2855506 RepID=UPI00224526BB|nr:pentapeptide repeat-containing protein [Streptomyces sp. SKN60]MCX2180841.1 pentapeptide repeat-containing protein [Streptomyces sp. SKN60]
MATTRTFDRVTVTTPDLDEPGLHLAKVDTLESPRGVMQDFAYAGADLRALDLADLRLLTGRIDGVRAQRATFEGLVAHDVEIGGSELGTARWSESRLSRVLVRDCKLLGAALSGVVLDDVLFERCKLDYATFERVRATGPVVFHECVLTEAVFTDCDLSGVVFSDCALRRAEFGAGRYRGADLRGNDLSTVRGIAHLAGVRIGPEQQGELAQALVGELGITVGDV